METGLVSVVIPVYNREDTIKRAIDSVLYQTYADLEVIVVDDGSDDNTIKIVEAYKDSRVTLICQKEHGGANKARNVGIASSRGEYIAFQDSDDEWLNDKLYQQIEFMKKEDFLACYCAYNIFENGTEYILPFDYTNHEKYQSMLHEILAKYNVIGTPALVIRREVLDLMNNEWFDEALPRMQDYDFVIRLIQAVKIGYINKPLINAYRSVNSITRDIDALYQAISRLISKHRDFLDIESFLKLSVLPNIISGHPKSNIRGLNRIQDALSGQDIDIKDMVISQMAEQMKMQDDLERKIYHYNICRLNNHSFSIYGAGKIGQQVYRELKHKGIYPKNFIVTKCDREEYIDHISVISLDQYDDKENMVIIAISRKYQAELMDNLISREFKNFCVYPDGTGEGHEMENISEQTLAIMSVYDPDGIVDDYIVYYLNSLKEVADRIIIVVNGMITDTGKAKLKRMTKDVFVRQNTGFDFGGHKTVLEEYLRPGEIDQYQQLILCNDTCFGPFVPFKTIFKTMHRRGLEFWSINYRDNILLPYYESYFIVLSGRALKLAVDFLHNDVDSGTGQINQARGYEHGLSELMMQQNVLAGCYTSGQEVYPNLDIYRSPDYAMKYLGLPLMKKKCFSSDIFERENCCEALRTIMEKTTYPVEYIIETISRVYGIQFQKKDLLVPNKTSAYAFWKFYVSRQDMIEFCEKNPKVYLYGKGYMAMFIYIRFRRYMNDFGGYIISDELYTDEMREDKMVYPLSRIHRDAPIIVALSEKNTGEVSGKLREWKNVIFLSMPQNGNREEG